jgi:hypothetical protein
VHPAGIEVPCRNPQRRPKWSKTFLRRKRSIRCYAQITNNVRLQDAKLQQLLVDYQNTVLKAQQEVNDGLSNFLLSQRKVGFLRRSVQAATGAFNVALDQYTGGATDFPTVLVAEQNLFQAQTDLLTASANVALGLTAVHRALGGGWQIRVDSNFVSAKTRDQMRARTDWGSLLASAGVPQPPAPGLPSPGDIGPTIRPLEWQYMANTEVAIELPVVCVAATESFPNRPSLTIDLACALSELCRGRPSKRRSCTPQ